MFLSDRVRRRWRQSENTAQNLEPARRLFPTNRIRDAVYARRGLKWGVPAMLLAAPYIAAVKLLTDHIEQGGPVGSTWSSCCAHGTRSRCSGSAR
ncbi:hypothetical protein [Kocuria sp. CPCC 205297]|uniref:hypothetical protein n=1 Tax=Kocuria sp. CPCC 205297 TaxID=3073558 RepID=UPI0034D51DA2